MRDHFNDIVGQFPFLGQSLASLAMRESHGGPFCLVQGNAFLAGALHGRGKFLGEGQAVHHEAQIMQ